MGRKWDVVGIGLAKLSPRLVDVGYTAFTYGRIVIAWNRWAQVDCL